MNSHTWRLPVHQLVPTGTIFPCRIRSLVEGVLEIFDANRLFKYIARLVKPVVMLHQRQKYACTAVDRDELRALELALQNYIWGTRAGRSFRDQRLAGCFGTLWEVFMASSKPCRIPRFCDFLQICSASN